MCLALGWPHPDYLLELLTGDQLTGWYDYSTREPFGFPIDDLRSAMHMVVTANSAGAKPPFVVEDFAMAEKLREPQNEDGSPSEATLIEKLKQAFPPARKREEGEQPVSPPVEGE